MRESEQALTDAADSAIERRARIARHILTDSNTHDLWEVRHASLVLPVAECGRRVPQIVELRRIEIKMIHCRALVNFVRRHKIIGDKRKKLFARFYGPKDIRDAILIEHRQYMLATSSYLSTSHLINIMHDPLSTDLLELYENVYTKYFELYCYVNYSKDRHSRDAVRVEMVNTRAMAKRIRARLEKVPPSDNLPGFDRQAALARSGRYPVLNYLLN